MTRGVEVVVVAVETSSFVASVAIVEDTTVLIDMSVQIGTVYAEQLPVLLDQACADIEMPIDQADGFAVSIGPGSYTGLRVGLSLIKGLAFATGKPLAAVPTLDTIGYRLPYSRYPICAMLDARRDHVYTADYETADGELQRRTPYRIMRLGALLSAVSTPTVFAGDGAVVHRKHIQETLGAQAYFLPAGLDVLSAVSVAFLGVQFFQRGESASLYDIEPLYLRRPDYVRQPPIRSDAVATLENAVDEK